MRCVGALARGVTALGEGRHADAFEHLSTMLDPTDPAYHHADRFMGIGYLADAAARCGQRELTRIKLTELERLSEVTSSPALALGIVYARPILADDHEAEPLYRTGLSELHRWPFIRARLELASGAWLRADPSTIEELGIEEIVDRYEQIIRGLGSPPIIIGHSFGGAFTEILLDRGLGAAGVAIDAAAVKGITKLPFSTLKSAFPVLKSPANRHRAVALTLPEFHYAFANTMTEEDAAPFFDRYAVPGPGRVLFQGAFANFNPQPRPASTSATRTGLHCC
jgi:pimeloyl-ACP methyl ester carboxylesterase